MPFLLRIIGQRLIILVLSSVTLLGLNPDANTNLNTESENQEKEKTTNFFSIPIPEINILNLPEANSTKIDDTKTSLPIIPNEPIKTPVIKVTEKLITPIPETTKQQASEIITPEQKPVEQKIEQKETTISSSIENVSVNILCLRQTGNKINLATGSGVIISSSGVVLTNSHVAQHFLLKDAGYKCSIRRENIPLYGFNAVPLYISEGWIEENYKQINNSSPTGTGKYDYALLLITSNTNPTISLPKFPSLKLNTSSNFLSVGDNVSVAGYPSVMTTSLEIAKNSSLVLDQAKIREVFTLGNNTVDVVSTTDTKVAQRGASGGGLFKNNELGGIVVSTNHGSSPGNFVVNVLTLDYINRELKNETGKTLSEFLSSDLSKQSKDFETVAPRLTELLMRNL